MPVPTQSRLYEELKRALAATRREDLKEWGAVSAKRLPIIAARRVKNLGRLATRVAKATSTELSDAFGAWRAGRLGTHLEDRTAAGIDGSIAVAKQTATAIGAVGSALLNDPRKNAPDVFALALGFYAGSGGLDGNGGVPDMDLALGIGWHRSVLTHSIVAGTVVEGAILGLADLAGVVCEKLPASERDPFWEKLVATKDRIALQLSAGASAGIAYHLAIDATIQPGTYHGLPGSMPEEAHHTLLAVNAAAEGLDATHKTETTGRKVVNAAAKARAYAGGFARGLIGGKQR